MSRPLADALARYPRVSLTRVPTPLDRVTRIGEQIGLDLYLKRDDLTDLAMGGDKPRKLEFVLGAAARARRSTAARASAHSSQQQCELARQRAAGHWKQELVGD